MATWKVDLIADLQGRHAAASGADSGLGLQAALALSRHLATVGLPTLGTATAPGVEAGLFFGSDGLLEMRGGPRRVEPSARARRCDVARRLWDVSEEVAGVSYVALSRSALRRVRDSMIAGARPS